MGGALNPILGGGTAFQALLNQVRALESADQAGRAQTGLGLLQLLTEQQLAASQRPISIIDQLLLGAEFGTISPFSQLSGERLAEFGIQKNPGQLGSLADIIAKFSAGAIPQAEVIGVFRENGVPWARVRLPGGGTGRITLDESKRGGLQTVAGRNGPYTVAVDSALDWLANQERNAQQPSTSAAPRPAPSSNAFNPFSPGTTPQDLGLPAPLSHGGSFTVNPRQAKTTASAAAGPVRMVDATGKVVAVAGEAGANTETISVTPRTATAIPPGDTPVPFPGAPAPLVTPEGTPRDVQFRFDALLEAAPDITLQQALDISRNPAGFEAFLGGKTDPRAQAARPLAKGLAQDLRFSDPFVRALALGRAPTPSELTARDVTILPQDLRDVLASLVGQGNFTQFLFELGANSPRGTNVRQGATAGLRI